MNQELEYLKYALNESAMLEKTDLQGYWIEVNDNYCNLLGYSREELLGSHTRKANSRYHPKSFFTGLWTTIKSGKTWHGEIKNQAKDGSFFWLDMTIIPKVEPLSGKIIEYMSISFVITDKLEALDEIYATTKTMAFDFDIEVNKMYWNSSAYDFYGLKKNTIISYSFYVNKIIYPEDRKRIELQFSQCLQNPLTNIFISQYRIIQQKTKAILFIKCRAQIVRDNKKNPIRFKGFVTDITQEKNNEARLTKLQQKQRQQEEKEKMIEQFLANMSHELRTPLNAILGFSDLLKNQFAGPLLQKQKDYIGEIFHAGTHLLKLIEHLLEFSKNKRDKLTLQKQYFSFLEWWTIHKGIIEQLANKKKITLVFNFSKSIKELFADKLRFTQIIYNLLSNAIKFTPKEGKVSFVVKEKADAFYFSVSDTGIGIKKEHHEKIFEPFTQLEVPFNKQYEGTGLGLPLSKLLIEAHGGRIWVESLKKGSKFSFTLPKK